jgi:hypothetical protein
MFCAEGRRAGHGTRLVNSNMRTAPQRYHRDASASGRGAGTCVLSSHFACATG